MRRLLVVLLVAACGEREIAGTACATDTDCNLFNAQGTCEATGFCSYPDPSCLGGQRYAPAAGDGLANTCFGDQSCGARTQVCCPGDACGDNLTCVIAETASCQCGDVGQPCCDGTTCNAGLGLLCDETQTCANVDVSQVAVGAGHTCSLRADGTVWCWGVDAKGFSKRTGIGAPVLSYPMPVQISGLANVAELRAGEFHTCAKKTDGTLWCWGHNESGQLGDGTFVSSRIPVQVVGLSAVTAFDAGRRSTCAVGTVGGNARLYCWGRGSVENRSNDATALGGRLGNASVADAPMPVAVDLSAAAPANQTVRTVAVGGYHTCMVMSDNTVWCWGRNAQGALGNNTLVASRVPVQVVLSGITIPNGVTIDEVTLTDGRRKEGSTCMRLSDGAAYCWGYNNSGELADGTNVNRSTPSTPITTTDLAGAKPVEIVSGIGFRCMRTDGGEVWCWGDNFSGSLGISATPTDFLTPQKIPTLSGVTEIDASHRTVCAIDGTKQLYCWGNNRRGNVTARPPQGLAEDFIFAPFQVTW